MSVEPRPSRRLDCGALSVLIVDDQPFFRVLLGEVLRNMGVRDITTAGDGEEALEALSEFTPDVILTDWMMPVMDGLELSKRIRHLRDRHTRMVPIILVTANNRKSQIETARGCGVDNFILKPISVKSVAERLREVIERPRPFVDTEAYVGPCRRRRKVKDYIGPMRRVDDPMELDTPVEVNEALRSMMELAASRISQLVRSLRKGDVTALKPIRLAAQEVRGLAEDLGDVHVARTCLGLARYIDSMPSPEAVRVDVLQTHLDAMEVLLKTPLSETRIREQVVRGLEMVVAKTLKAA